MLEAVGAVIRTSCVTPIRIKNYVEKVVSNYCDTEFKNNFRLKRSTFEKLVEIIGPILIKQTMDSNFIRRDILAVIWLLATPDSYRYVFKHSFKYALQILVLFQIFV